MNKGTRSNIKMKQNKKNMNTQEHNTMSQDKYFEQQNQSALR